MTTKVNTDTTVGNGTGQELAVLTPQQLGLVEQLGIQFADPTAISWRIAERLAVANSLEELLSGEGPEGLRDHLGERFQVRAVEYLPSRFKGSPVYALISAVNENGEPVTYTSGALSVVIQLARGLQMGWWTGEWVKAVYSTDEAGPDGNRPYKLTPA